MFIKIGILLISFQVLVTSGTPIHSPIEYIGKFPYHVSVRDPSGKHICGGAIVKSNIILAPGLCMNQGLADHIVAGSVDPKADKSDNFTQTVKIVQTQRNIGFFGEKFMVVYFLDNALKFGYGVEPIKIATTEPKEMKPARISGFVEQNGEKKLRSVEQKIGNYVQCKSLINHAIYNDVLVCTTSGSRSDVCKALEDTSLLVCHGKEMELCAFPLSYKNFMCTDSDSIKNDTVVSVEDDVVDNVQKEYIASFIKISSFQDWLQQHGVL